MVNLTNAQRAMHTALGSMHSTVGKMHSTVADWFNALQWATGNIQQWAMGNGQCATGNI